MFEAAYLFRLCDLLGDVLDRLDQLEERSRPVAVNSASGAELVTEPAPDAAGGELVDEVPVDVVDQADAEPAPGGAPTTEPAAEPAKAAPPKAATRRGRRGTGK